jgi:hypothetical protein
MTYDQTFLMMPNGMQFARESTEETCIRPPENATAPNAFPIPHGAAPHAKRFEEKPRTKDLSSAKTASKGGRHVSPYLHPGFLDSPIPDESKNGVEAPVESPSASVPHSATSANPSYMLESPVSPGRKFVL